MRSFGLRARDNRWQKNQKAHKKVMSVMSPFTNYGLRAVFHTVALVGGMTALGFPTVELAQSLATGQSVALGLTKGLLKTAEIGVTWATQLHIFASVSGFLGLRWLKDYQEARAQGKSLPSFKSILGSTLGITGGFLSFLPGAYYGAKLANAAGLSAVHDPRLVFKAMGEGSALDVLDTVGAVLEQTRGTVAGAVYNFLDLPFAKALSSPEVTGAAVTVAFGAAAGYAGYRATRAVFNALTGGGGTAAPAARKAAPRPA